MFKGLGNLAEMMKRVGRMRGEMERIGEELKQVVAEGSAGGGMVRIRVNGKQEVIECKIDPSALADSDVEMLEDLVVAAMNQAMERSRSAAAEKISQMGGLNLASLNLAGPIGDESEGDEKGGSTGA